MNNLNEELTRAYLLQHQGHHLEALEIYKAILQRHPDHPHTLHCAALSYAQLGEWEAARKFFLQALELLPNDPVLHNNVANIYKKQQEWALAIDHYHKAIQSEPNYSQAHNNLAAIYAEKNDYPLALLHYKAAIHAEPDFIAAHYNLGLLFLKFNKLLPAETQFNNVLKLNPNYSDARFYSGIFHLNAERLEEAEESFKGVILQHPEHTEALTNLGVIALKKKHDQLAIDYFTKAMALSNSHIEARNNLAATFMHHDRFENALVHYDILLQQAPHNIEYLYNSGVAQMALGHLNQAIIFFERLLTLDSKYFAALTNLSAIYIRMNDRKKAEELLQLALEVNPQDKSSRHMLNALKNSETTADTCPEYATNLFNNYAIFYDSHMKNFLNYSLPNQIVNLISELNSFNWNEGLDLGCGTGLVGQAIKDYCTSLTGVDISGKMLAQAMEKNIYQHLYEKNLVTFLQENSKKFDLILAADVLPYFGSLDELFLQISNHLNPNGYFIFTTEIAAIYPWHLQTNARFSHHHRYLKKLAETGHLKQIACKTVIARTQEKAKVHEYLIVLQK